MAGPAAAARRRCREARSRRPRPARTRPVSPRRAALHFANAKHSLSYCSYFESKRKRTGFRDDEAALFTQADCCCRFVRRVAPILYFVNTAAGYIGVSEKTKKGG